MSRSGSMLFTRCLFSATRITHRFSTPSPSFRTTSFLHPHSQYSRFLSPLPSVNVQQHYFSSQPVPSPSQKSDNQPRKVGSPSGAEKPPSGPQTPLFAPRIEDEAYSGNLLTKFFLAVSVWCVLVYLYEKRQKERGHEARTTKPVKQKDQDIFVIRKGEKDVKLAPVLKEKQLTPTHDVGRVEITKPVQKVEIEKIPDLAQEEPQSDPDLEAQLRVSSATTEILPESTPLTSDSAPEPETSGSLQREKEFETSVDIPSSSTENLPSQPLVATPPVIQQPSVLQIPDPPTISYYVSRSFPRLRAFLSSPSLFSSRPIDTLTDEEIEEEILKEKQNIQQLSSNIAELEKEQSTLISSMKSEQIPLYESLQDLQLHLNLISSSSSRTESKLQTQLESLNQAIASLSSVSTSYTGRLNDVRALAEKTRSTRGWVNQEFSIQPRAEDRLSVVSSLLSLHIAIVSGRPFLSELLTFQQSLHRADLNEALSIAQNISHQTAETGILTTSQLASRFGHVKNRVREVAYVPGDGGVKGHLWSAVLARVTVEEPPSLQYEGSHPEFILARAAAYLQGKTDTSADPKRIEERAFEESLQKCVEEMKQLKGFQKEVASDWIRCSEDHLSTLSLLNTLTTLTQLYLYESYDLASNDGNQ